LNWTWTWTWPKFSSVQVHRNTTWQGVATSMNFLIGPVLLLRWILGLGLWKHVGEIRFRF
jgi:hypothetical protein